MNDSVRFEDFGLFVQEGHEHPEMPVFERKVVFIPGRPGVWDFGEEIRERPPLRFPLGIIEDRLILQYRLRQLKEFLYDDFGKARIIKIVYDYEPGRFYLAKCLTNINPVRFATLAEFVLEFQTVDPYKYSNVYADEVIWGSEVITFEYDYLLGHTNDFGGEPIRITRPQTVNITASGLAVQPVLNIEGSANNLTLSANGHSFSLPNFSNTKWEIDFNRYVVFRNGHETMEEIWDFHLIPGNNEILITGSNIDINLSVKFRDKYN